MLFAAFSYMDGIRSGVDWDWSVVYQVLPYLLKATLITLQLAVTSILIGTVIGLVIALMKISRFTVLRRFGQFYTWFFRGIPLLVQLFVIYYGLAAFLHIDMQAKTAAIIGISLCGGGYIAEIIRAGILSIDHGQMEAALSLGMTREQALRRIIIPQTYLRLLPPLGNEFINLIKDTTLASVITVAELLRVAQVHVGDTFKPFEIYFTAAIIYLLLTTILTAGLTYMEKKLGAKS